MNDLFRSLTALLKEFPENEDLREPVIFAAWKKIAGEVIREQTVPVTLEKDRLAVAVSSEIWKCHLEDLSGQMIFKLNSALGAMTVTFIEFRVDEKLVEAENRRLQGAKADPEEQIRNAIGEITPKLRDSAGAIKDDQLRERFLMAAGMCLSRKKTLTARD